MPPELPEPVRQSLLATFQAEAEEHLATLAAAVDALRAATVPGDRDRLLELTFRTMHTLKGAARSVGLRDIERIGQLSEGILRDLRSSGQVPMRAVEALALACDAVAGLLAGSLPPARFDAVEEELELLAAEVSFGTAMADAAPASPPGAVVEAAAMPAAIAPPLRTRAAAAGSVRVELDRLARLGGRAESLLLSKLAAADHARSAARLQTELGRVRANRRRTASAGDEGLREIEAGLRRLVASLRREEATLGAAIDGLIADVGEIRMLPVAAVLGAFPGMVRDLGRETGKQAAWSVAGGDIAVDRAVLDRIKDPLIHLVRNAIDHGIERPDVRQRAGKPSAGRIALTVRRLDAGRVEIALSDDGGGIAVDAVRAAAVRSRAVDRDGAGGITDGEALEMIFRAGLSTSPVISGLSGNGIGLSIVREAIERIDGQVAVESAPGQGTTIRISLPSSIVTHRGLLVTAGDSRLLWPSEAVERVIGVPRAELAASLSRGFHPFDGEALPIGRLTAALGLAGVAADDRSVVPAIVARSAGRRGLVVVDTIVGEREVIIKDLRPPLHRVRNILSAGLLGTGELALVARPSDILACLGEDGIEAEANGEEVRRRRILVVDDSLTTRTMERNLLEAAGYAVKTSPDGAEGFALLQAEAFDLVVSDVDMPRMDGFELTERIRAEDRFAHLPVVLVTALESRQDRERGVRAGANAYVVKSAFDQTNLLEIVRRLA